MYGKCGRWMERKKREVPGEVCMRCSERSNYYRKHWLYIGKERKGYLYPSLWEVMEENEVETERT